MNNLAFYYIEHDPSDRNLETAETLIANMPDKYKSAPNVQDTTAWLHYRKGEYKKARDTLLPVAEQAQLTPEISYHLGMIYFELGEKKTAKDFLENAVKTDNLFAGKDTAEETLKRLQ